jgi:DNA polymerase-3 subunit gamma/tau
VYIIDEVHMLSTAAFNALLKTMEEPPEHVVFILCTTETHKVPATVQSRCQRYDFRNIPSATIAKHLTEIIKSEGFTAEDELLMTVARLGNGSMRDALSLLDRVAASGEKHLTLVMLERLLGLPDRELTSQLIDSIAAGDAAGALERTSELLGKGLSIDQLCTTLAERFRDLLVLSTCGQHTDLVDMADSARVTATAQAARFNPATLVYMIAMIESVAKRTEESGFPRALLDAMIARLAMTDKLAEVTAVVTAAGRAALEGGVDAARSAPAKK